MNEYEEKIIFLKSKIDSLQDQIFDSDLWIKELLMDKADLLTEIKSLKFEKEIG